jgi:hypothetical protein
VQGAVDRDGQAFLGGPPFPDLLDLFGGGRLLGQLDGSRQCRHCLRTVWERGELSDGLLHRNR